MMKYILNNIIYCTRCYCDFFEDTEHTAFGPVAPNKRSYIIKFPNSTYWCTHYYGTEYCENLYWEHLCEYVDEIHIK